MYISTSTRKTAREDSTRSKNGIILKNYDQTKRTYSSDTPLRKSLRAGTALALLLLMPVYLLHAQFASAQTSPQSVTFTTTADGNWQYDSGFHDNGIYYHFITSDGRGRSSIGTDSQDTGIPASVQMEFFVANTNGGTFSNTCSSPSFTGNATTDFACEATVAKSQGYAYAFGQTWTSPPVITTAPCVCP